MSTAVHTLSAKNRLENLVYFEASAFGMFILIKALHGFVWQATHYDLDAPASRTIVSNRSSSNSKLPEIVSRLEQDFSGATISDLLSEVITNPSFDRLHGVNQALENWHQIWIMRQVRDGEYENRAFALNPVPFFWLAQLFILLHCGSSDIANDSEFVTAKLKESDVRGRMRIQDKIFEWLLRLKRRDGCTQIATGKAFLADLIEPVIEN